MTEIYLIRHGEAEGNVFRRLHGQYNSLLMPRGYAQAECIRKRFADIQIDAVYSSDLTRACLTSRSLYIPRGLKLNRDSRFRELHVGVWEDLSYGYLDNFEPEKMWQFSHDPKAWFVNGSERYEQYTSRFVSAMKDAASVNDGKTIAIFAHGAVLRGTLMHLFFDDQADSLPLSDNAGVSRLFYENGKFSYDYLNDNSHIPEELSTFYIQAWWRKTDNRKAANLYFVPYDQSMILPEELNVPRGETVVTAMLQNLPVGMLAMGAQEGTCGMIQGMTLLPEMTGRGYADQMLGCAVSHFRRLGCRQIRLVPGEYPDAVNVRYDFDLDTWCRNINANHFSW